MVLTPRLTEAGGVANYYRVLRGYLPGNLEYFYVGRDGSDGRVASAVRLLRDYANFVGAVMRRPVTRVIHLNPSLRPKAVVRDGLFAVLAACLGRRTIVFFRGWDREVERSISDSWLRRALFRFAFGSSTRIVVLSESFAAALKSWGIQAPVSVELTVVDDSILQQDLPPMADRRLKLLFMARLERTKGTVELVEAFRELRQRWPELQLTIAGDGPEFGPLRELIMAEGIEGIHLPGHVSGNAKAACYVSHGIFVLPSYGEGMPNAMLEAMGYGMGVVVTAVGGIPEMFKDGRMGFLLPGPDPQQIVEAVERLLSDPERLAEMGSYNREYIRERCVASAAADRLAAMYAEAAAVPGTSSRR